MNVMVLTISNISHTINVVSRFMANLSHEHWKVIQWTMRYLKVTVEFGLLYGGLNEEKLKLLVMFIQILLEILIR